MLPEVIVFSSVSGYTWRFATKLQAREPNLEARRLPLRKGDPDVDAARPFVLLTPTYGSGSEGGAVPKQVIRFLNVKANRELLRGVVSFGNTNFGTTYCIAGDIISAKTGAPHLARVELFGTPEDEVRVLELLRAVAAG